MFKDSFLYLFFSAAIISLYILKSIGLFFYSEISITYAPSLRSNLSLDLLLTISLRMLISLKSIRFSSSSMWLFLSTFTALCAVDSLCTHILTSPNAPKPTITLCKTFVLTQCAKELSYLCRGSFQFCNDL